MAGSMAEPAEIVRPLSALTSKANPSGKKILINEAPTREALIRGAHSNIIPAAG